MVYGNCFFDSYDLGYGIWCMKQVWDIEKSYLVSLYTKQCFTVAEMGQPRLCRTNGPIRKETLSQERVLRGSGGQNGQLSGHVVFLPSFLVTVWNFLWGHVPVLTSEVSLVVVPAPFPIQDGVSWGPVCPGTLCHCRWTPYSTSQVLGLQACLVTPDLCGAADRTQGFLLPWVTHTPSPEPRVLYMRWPAFSEGRAAFWHN